MPHLPWNRFMPLSVRPRRRLLLWQVSFLPRDNIGTTLQSRGFFCSLSFRARPNFFHDRLEHFPADPYEKEKEYELIHDYSSFLSVLPMSEMDCRIDVSDWILRSL